MKKKLPAEKDGERRPETKDDSGIKGCGGEGGREVVSDGGASSGGGGGGGCMYTTRVSMRQRKNREREREGKRWDFRGFRWWFCIKTC